MDELLEGIGAADIVDAMGRSHRHRCHLVDFVSPAPDRVLFGPAVTISFFPSCDERLDPKRYNFAALFYEAIGEEPEGKVLVLASNGYPDTSLGGGTKLARVQNHDMAGVLADGRLRDFEELAGYDFATYCRGETTRWGGDRIRPYQANVPVVISGVGVMPGDYVYADASGTVVVPAGEIEAILEEANRVADEDARFIDEIGREDPSTGEYGGPSER
jgi:4-hydroxy-4-methyl-2-oxoglutarate aldolase